MLDSSNIQDVNGAAASAVDQANGLAGTNPAALADKVARLSGFEAVQLVCGESENGAAFITLYKDGRIEVSGKSISFDATDKIGFYTDGEIEMKGGKKIDIIRGTKSSIKMSAGGITIEGKPFLNLNP